MTAAAAGAIGLALTLAAWTALANDTGFIADRPDVRPRSGSYLSRSAIRIKTPNDKIVIVYNHGTTRPQRAENCSAPSNQVPRSLLNVQSERVLIYYLCSRASEANARAAAGEYIYARMKEIEATLDELLAAGVPARNIFLAGHSAGAWTSLMVMQRAGTKFNAAILFAPAFAGRRSEQSTYPWWYAEVRPKQIRQMLAAPSVRALVFAYYNDPFERPEDLGFLTERYPETVQMIAYECDVEHRHFVHLNDCREQATTEAIARYIARMSRLK